MHYRRRRPGRTWRSIGRAAATDRCRGRTRTSASRSRTTCPGRRAATTSSSGSSPSATARPSPDRNDYTGVYNFGHSADNPLSTGNGYANALLGVFTRYDERDNRVDREVRHWQADSYAQDSWRLSPRLTMDYGLRVTHHGAVYETRDMNSAFDPDLWQANQAAVLYRPFCRPNGVPGNQACAADQPRGDQPDHRQRSCRRPSSGPSCPGPATSRTGSSRAVSPGKKNGWYYDMPALSWAPRVGIAWDVTGDGKTAIRASGGIFYNFINRSQYLYNGGPLVSQVRSVRNSTLDELDDVARVGNLVVSPQQVNIPAGFALPLHGKQWPQGELAAGNELPGQRRVPARHRLQHRRRGRVGRQLRPPLLADEDGQQHRAVRVRASRNNLFRNEPINANFLRRDYPGLGAIRYLTTDDDILNYNAMQVSVQRRLITGLQMGLAYTLSKARASRAGTT